MQVRQVLDIEYRLLPGADRRTTDIVIERDGRISVRPPLSMKPEQVDATVLSRRGWIYRHLAEWRDLNATRVVREWVNGEAFPYLGANYRLSLVGGQEEPLLLKDGRFCLSRAVVDAGGGEGARLAFRAFYEQKGRERLGQRVAQLAAKVGVRPGKVAVKELGYRWASCTRAGNLNFHWKCMMAPGTIIDYIVAHELCHLHHRDHSAAFWNELDKVLPDYLERKAWLRRHGTRLDL